MKKFLFYIIVLLAVKNSVAQDFLTKGTIEYEVKVNAKRMYGEMMRGRDKNNQFGGDTGPEFYITKRKMLFNGDKILYMPDGNDPYAGMGGTTVYTDLSAGESIFKSAGFMDESLFSDSVSHIRWKIEDETRLIAGFKCRKAVGVIMDSVYVVAFYSTEIVPQGGPEMFGGLPGMILGMAIPRCYTTWFATKVQLEVDEKKLVAPAPSKKEKIKTMTEARTAYLDQLKAFMDPSKASSPEKVNYQMKGLIVPGSMRW